MHTTTLLYIHRSEQVPLFPKKSHTAFTAKPFGACTSANDIHTLLIMMRWGSRNKLEMGWKTVRQCNRQLLSTNRYISTLTLVRNFREWELVSHNFSYRYSFWKALQQPAYWATHGPRKLSNSVTVAFALPVTGASPSCYALCNALSFLSPPRTRLKFSWRKPICISLCSLAWVVSITFSTIFVSLHSMSADTSFACLYYILFCFYTINWNIFSISLFTSGITWLLNTDVEASNRLSGPHYHCSSNVTIPKSEPVEVWDFVVASKSCDDLLKCQKQSLY